MSKLFEIIDSLECDSSMEIVDLNKNDQKIARKFGILIRSKNNFFGTPFSCHFEAKKLMKKWKRKRIKE